MRGLSAGWWRWKQEEQGKLREKQDLTGMNRIKRQFSKRQKGGTNKFWR